MKRGIYVELPGPSKDQNVKNGGKLIVRKLAALPKPLIRPGMLP